MSLFHISIVTPRGEILAGETESLVVPGEEGYLGILAGHAPMIAALRAGVLTLRTGDQNTYYAVDQGVLEVANDRALVLVDEAEMTATGAT
jgi:F-type H+-transporting ATPase subunit epsilon